MRLWLLVFISASAFAGEVSVDRYYQPLKGKFGYELKTEIKNVLASTHRDRGYKALFHVYFESDIDNSYDQDGTIVDMYSEDPRNQDPYTFSDTRHMCGNYRAESDCFNREHIFPQGTFGKQYPMRSDFFHIYPTDGMVNNRRGSLPFGEVSDPSWTSQNGSKVGTNTFSNYRGNVFEPIDEFKGDIARALLYFATRYEDQISNWNHEMLDGSKDQVYADWFIRLLLKWHKQDPVSRHEIQRNNAGYKFQGNRNPFIDHPEWVEKIWSNI